MKTELEDQLISGLAAQWFRKQSERQLALSQPRPEAPRGLRIEDGILKWDPPQDPWGVTHYNIYAEDERKIQRQIPAGQTQCADYLAGRRFYVSSWNCIAGGESSKAFVDAGAAIIITPPGTGGAMLVGERVFVFPDVQPDGTLTDNAVNVELNGKGYFWQIAAITAPGAGGATFDVLYDGTSIYTTLPALPSGAVYASGTFTGLDMLKDHVLRGKQVTGNGVVGASLTLYYKP